MLCVSMYLWQWTSFEFKFKSEISIHMLHYYVYIFPESLLIFIRILLSQAEFATSKLLIEKGNNFLKLFGIDLSKAAVLRSDIHMSLLLI